MGVLNVTPDSFSDGGRFPSTDAAIAEGRRLAGEGAAILDIGGESTRPGAQPVSESAELQRVLPVIEALAATAPRISIDTMKPAVAAAGLRAGATLVNDVTGLRDPEMARVVASHGAGIVIMHMRGTPATMRGLAAYSDVVADVKAELAPRIQLARGAGISEIFIDPGLGFAKTPEQSFEILRRLHEFQDLGCPILIGPSRKSFLGVLPGSEHPGARLEATLAAVVVAALHGASVVRVHDVLACRKALAVADTVKEGRWTESS